MIVALRRQYGSDWAEIARQLGTNREQRAVKDRFYGVISKQPNFQDIEEESEDQEEPPSFEDITDPSIFLADFNVEFACLPQELNASTYKIINIDAIPLQRKRELLNELNMLLISRKMSNN
jgi:hypothetical protein